MILGIGFQVFSNPVFRFYHIDTAFCPLNEEVAIYYKYAFDHLTQHNMRNETGLIEVRYQKMRTI